MRGIPLNNDLPSKLRLAAQINHYRIHGRPVNPNSLDL